MEEITIPLDLYRSLHADSQELRRLRDHGAPKRMMTQKEVCDFLRIGRTKLYELRVGESFPKPFGAAGLIRWFADDVEAWARSVPRSY